MEKKNIAIIILAVALVASGIGNIILALPAPAVAPPEKVTLIRGTSSGPLDLEPLNGWDSASNDVIRHVAEGLFFYDLNDENLTLTPWLAKDFGVWEDNVTYTLQLKENIWFHDYTPFNAEAVKFTFYRMLWFLNDSKYGAGYGYLNTTHVMGPAMLYQLPDAPPGSADVFMTSVIDDVIINSAYNVTFKLNKPYALFEKILAYVCAYILSPLSTPKWEYIDTATGVLVGTGQYKYIHYIADTEVRFERWGGYWGRAAYFEEMIFAVIEDSTARNNAMLAHDIDHLSGAMTSLLPTFDTDTTITHYANPQTGLSYYYLGMNNKRINATWREAISYAINYTYIIEELQDGTVARAYSPVAEAFIPGFDQSTLGSADYNLAYARTVMNGMGFGVGFTTDAEWTAVAQGTSPFGEWNYSYNIGNDFREDLYVLLRDNLALIGINVIDQGMSWADYIYRAYGYMEPGGFDTLMLYWVGWGPDYLDPFNMLAPLLLPGSTSNSAQVNDSVITSLLQGVLLETDEAVRTQMYKWCLGNLSTVVRPHAFGYHPEIHSVHSADLAGVSYNAKGDYWAYDVYRIGDADAKQIT
jgi:peptide/nickel transport system substrate-binding protein